MIVKDLSQIVKIIEKGVPDWVVKAEKEHIRLDTHFNGKDTDKYLVTIDNIENSKQYYLRKTFLTTNRHVFETLSRPIDKVFSAKGGSRVYNLNTDTKEKTLKAKLSNIRHGKSIHKWIKDIQANKYYTDPAGLVFFEWEKNRTYPTIKTIKCIQNYRSDGRTLDWLLFRPKAEMLDGRETGNKLYRFVDDAYDYIIKESNGEYTILEDEMYKNPFEAVPAIINSDIVNSDLTYNESPFEVVISLADHYLRTGSIKNLVEFLHGYPIFWRYLSDCRTCKGTGYIDGDTCPVCSGTGKNLSKDVTDIIQLERPEGDEPILAPNIAGYVTPDVASLQEMRVEQLTVKELMELALWGSKMVKDTSNETATAAFLNVQPVNDRLNSFSDAFEDMEKKMTDLIGKFYLKTYDGASIHYGRRFLVEPPDVIFEKYQNAREKGINKVTLDYLLMQYYQTEYANDLEGLTAILKGIKLEPFVHKTDEELIGLPISNEDKKAKIYFNEWFKSLNEIDILTKDITDLNKMFNEYLKTKENEVTVVQGV